MFAFFKSVYEFMSRKTMDTYVRCNNWLVDKLTGEILDELDANPTFLGTFINAGKRTLLGKRDSSVIGAVIRNAIIALGAIGGGALAAGLGYTFSTGFMIALIAIYGVVFVFNLVLELYKNRIRKASNEVLDSVLSGC